MASHLIQSISQSFSNDTKLFVIFSPTHIWLSNFIFNLYSVVYYLPVLFTPFMGTEHTKDIFIPSPWHMLFRPLEIHPVPPCGRCSLWHFFLLSALMWHCHSLCHITLCETVRFSQDVCLCYQSSYNYPAHMIYVFISYPTWTWDSGW